MIRSVALDMDGVLVDLIPAVMALFAVPAEQARNVHTWDGTSKAIGEYRGEAITEAEVWAAVEEAGAWVWAEAQPTEWFHELKRAVGTMPALIVTTPLHRAPAPSVQGKLAWLRRWWPEVEMGAVFVRDKGTLATPTRLLIDDGEHQIKSWRAQGGPAMLWPAPWNPARAIDTRDYPTDALRNLRDALSASQKLEVF